MTTVMLFFVRPETFKSGITHSSSFLHVTLSLTVMCPHFISFALKWKALFSSDTKKPRPPSRKTSFEQTKAQNDRLNTTFSFHFLLFRSKCIDSTREIMIK